MVFAEERQDQVAKAVAVKGRMTVADLALAFGVSEDTIRRDLRALTVRGVLHKTHGGAVALDVASMTWSAREGVEAGSKAAVGARAAALVEAGQSVVLDAGSTVLELARRITARPLSVLTNSLDVAALFAADPQVRLALTGGDWDAGSRHLTGSAALATLASRRADWAFLGACAVHAVAGVTSVSDADAAVKRAMMACAERSVLLYDHTKHALVEPHLVAPLAAFHALVTDDPAAAPDGGDGGPLVLLAPAERQSPVST